MGKPQEQHRCFDDGDQDLHVQVNMINHEDGTKAKLLHVLKKRVRDQPGVAMRPKKPKLRLPSIKKPAKEVLTALLLNQLLSVWPHVEGTCSLIFPRSSY